MEIGLPRKKVQRLCKLRQLGFHLANLCEENVVYVDGKEYCERKASPESLKHIDIYFASGPRNASDVCHYRPEYADRVVESGNPRFDTLLPKWRAVYESEARNLRERFGRFLLVNTNFGRSNPFQIGKDIVTALKEGGLINNEEHEAYVRRQIKYKHHQMIGLQTLLEDFSNYSFFDRIIIRPHPVENHNVWKSWAENVKGVEVHFERNANCWMLAAEAVLHTGCTTGIEGVLLDRPVFSYTPVPKSEFFNQSDAVSIRVNNARELSLMVKEIIGMDDKKIRHCYTKQRSELSKYIRNIEPPLASDVILDKLEMLDLPFIDIVGFNYNQKPLVKIMKKIKRVGHFIRDGGKRIKRAHQKFPILDKDDLLNPLNLWLKAGVISRIPKLHRADERLWVVY